ncbi:hypothetical protein LWI29_017618 [Acer saccharum]|uniref:Protein kinase domain-containing protein n=1 Tax=Acer saccharum TaxID=4024 RepID=A0AA39V7X4_ACESA|nr:hypothetical protein LWI29_017618 [Acer saccharum]
MNLIVEYGSQGIVSVTGDVYSFGILMMETFTRKKPTDNMFEEGMSLKLWVKEALPDSAKDDNVAYINKEKPPIKMYGLLLNLAFGALAEQAGALLLRRIRKYDSERSMLDKQLLRNFIPNFPSKHHNIARGLSSYLALHLIFEEDIVPYSQCDFRGGKDERNELNFKHTMKSISLDLLMERLKKSKYVFSNVVPVNM